jgi:predicted nucleotidyltransferase
MPSLTAASLTPQERRVLDRLVRLLQKELGPDLHSVWLYGSRARGEPPRPESDVDILVVASRDRWDDQLRLGELATEAAEAEGANPVWFSLHVYTPERIAQRREIRSFFLQEVDRDKIVLCGEP